MCKIEQIFDGWFRQIENDGTATIHDFAWTEEELQSFLKNDFRKLNIDSFAVFAFGDWWTFDANYDIRPRKNICRHGRPQGGRLRLSARR